MAPADAKETFLRIPWAKSLIDRPNTVFRVPNSRRYKSSTEDSLFAETLKTSRTLRSALVFYQKPPPELERVEEVSTLFTLGDGINGHANMMHGGIIATLLDEAMGMLQGANNEHKHSSAVAQGKAEGELPPPVRPSFTAEMKIKFLKPVQTPGALIVNAKYIKSEERKEWIYAEIKQRENADEDYDGDVVLCATAEALFIEPKPRTSKL